MDCANIIFVLHPLMDNKMNKLKFSTMFLLLQPSLHIVRYSNILLRIMQRKDVKAQSNEKQTTTLHRKVNFTAFTKD